jgi:hypothetical protein
MRIEKCEYFLLGRIHVLESIHFRIRLLLIGWLERKMINLELPSNFLRRGHSCAAAIRKLT